MQPIKLQVKCSWFNCFGAFSNLKCIPRLELTCVTEPIPSTSLTAEEKVIVSSYSVANKLGCIDVTSKIIKRLSIDSLKDGGDMHSRITHAIVHMI
ncbi:hypothetical protein NPIL_58571 [Nephila pilipes]|uniref:Uncharacterized protein n=1 Tax=Nephila pilipes TaxID=299642 RepID=A0A8X6PLT4_NEPPI|nr:hypothetical protein NPIL_58571 [Nephila pilipes]